VEVMREQTDDARAVYIAWRLGGEHDVHQDLQRAAEMGYAPAQAQLATLTEDYGVSFE
jgi:hypothetical protein